MTSLKSKFWKSAGNSDFLRALAGAGEVVYYQKGAAVPAEEISGAAAAIYATEFGTHYIPSLPLVGHSFSERPGEPMEIPEVRRDLQIAIVEIDGDSYQHVANVDLTRNKLSGNFAEIRFPGKRANARARELEGAFRSLLSAQEGDRVSVITNLPIDYSPTLQLWVPVEASAGFSQRAGEFVSRAIGIYSAGLQN